MPAIRTPATKTTRAASALKTASPTVRHRQSSSPAPGARESASPGSTRTGSPTAANSKGGKRRTPWSKEEERIYFEIAAKCLRKHLAAMIREDKRLAARVKAKGIQAHTDAFIKS